MTDLEQAQAYIDRIKPKDSLRPIGQIDPMQAAPSFDDHEETAVTSPAAQYLKAGRVKLDTLDTAYHPKVAQAVKMARLWGQRKMDGHQDASLVLCGGNGVGKTHIALAIWWAMTTNVTDAPRKPGDYGRPLSEYQPRPTGHFFLSNDLLMKLGTSRDPETGIASPVRPASLIGYPPLIVIDDIGMEQAIPFVRGEDQVAERQARFFKVINHCVGYISVIITSNLPWPELAAYIGKRSADRLLQMAPRLPGTEDSFIVDLFGVPSYRQAGSGR